MGRDVAGVLGRAGVAGGRTEALEDGRGRDWEILWVSFVATVAGLELAVVVDDVAWDV